MTDKPKKERPQFVPKNPQPPSQPKPLTSEGVFVAVLLALVAVIALVALVWWLGSAFSDAGVL